MITEILTQNGRKITANDAVILRDQARAQGLPDPIHFDPSTGETLIKPRRGSDTLLCQRQAHFYHPSDVREAGLGNEKRDAINGLESMLQRSGDFVEMRKGLLQFRDNKLSLESGFVQPDFDYGLHVLWARKNDGKEYALLVVNRTPQSNDYLNLVKDLGNRQRFSDGLNIEKFLVDGKERVPLGNTIYLATVQVRNNHMFRLNQESPHQSECLMLGDWQTEHLSTLYPEFVYFNPETKGLDVFKLVEFKHGCSYSDYRYAFKEKSPEEAPKYCKKLIPKFENMDRFTLKPFEIKKDLLKGKIKNHPRLYLAQIAPQEQLTLF